MRVYEVQPGGGGLDGLKLAERDMPTPGPTGVLVKVHATALNFRDQSVLKGRHASGTIDKPTIPLSDGAGEAVETGPAVRRFKAGDRVAGCFFQNWTGGPYTTDAVGSELGGAIDGMLAEYVVLDQGGLVRIPDSLTFQEAATLPCAGLTAWHALFPTGGLTVGQSVLALGTGGVSIFALQFAKMTGAHVVMTSSSDEKLERAKSLGADATVNYQTTPDWADAVMAATGGRGVDHVIEVGGAETLPKSIASLRTGGKIYQIGFVTGWESTIVLPQLVAKDGTLKGIYVGNRAMFEDMSAAIDVNGLKPVVDRVFPFDDAPAAYEYQASSAHFGKVVIAGAGA